MKSKKKTVLIEARHSPFVSDEDDVEGKLEDYYDEFMSLQVEEHILSALENNAIRTPHDAFEHGYVTRGQWLLWVVENFYGQMTNGGIAQFLVNCEELIADVAIALEFLELAEFADVYLKLVEPLINDLDKNRRAAKGLSFFRQIRAKYRDYDAIHQEVLDRAKDSGIGYHFVKQWDEERGALFWPPEFWSQQMLTRTVAYIETHLDDFQHISSA